MKIDFWNFLWFDWLFVYKEAKILSTTFIFQISVIQILSCPSAGWQIYAEEHIQFDQRGKGEENKVHDQTSSADSPVQFEFVARESDVEKKQGGEECDGRILQTSRIDANKMLTGLNREKDCFNKPRHPQAEENVKGIRTD